MCEKGWAQLNLPWGKKDNSIKIQPNNKHPILNNSYVWIVVIVIIIFIFYREEFVHTCHNTGWYVQHLISADNE